MDSITVALASAKPMLCKKFGTKPIAARGKNGTAKAFFRKPTATGIKCVILVAFMLQSIHQKRRIERSPEYANADCRRYVAE